MNLLLKLVTRAMDGKCQDWEAKSEACHRVPGDVEEFLDVAFDGAGGTPLKVDIFRPKEHDHSGLPVLIMIHGGGLVVGSRKLSRTFCENLAEKGFLVFAPEYRLATETDAISEIGDVYSALSFVSDHLEEYGGDPDQVAVASESAGSFLAIYAVAAINSSLLRETFGLKELSLHVCGLACFSGMFYTTRRDVLRLTYAGTIYGKRKKDPSFMQLMNPECPEVMNHLPPMFIVGSDKDFLKSYTKRYANALRDAGHPCEFIYYENNKELNHAFPALKPDLPESREVMEKLIVWTEQMNEGRE